MHTSFEAALGAVFSVEGGYVDHPADPGGPTHFGVTRETLARARGRPATAADVMALGRDEAAAIYRRFYWDAVRADDLPAGLDLAVFDLAVNSGPRRAALLLHGALGLPPDAEIGPAALAAAQVADQQALIRALSRARVAFLRRLAGWPTFGTGWARRVAAIERAALALANASTTPNIQERRPMDALKPILQSRTVWSNLIGLGAIALAAFGFDTGGVDSGQLADTALQVVAGLSFIASTAFRVLATHRLS
ncbi:hypothetical protein GCM10007036_12930 [Alsobacter metallidurans]|uniref:TtsA-like Glycoside hydrolase family 108 domain-containing protein n=1 Tax=Alsobacter metallidurans TaxID=340221 RepID=A0A917MGB8_9HYPH|nr:glycoside hydrolase family 108 protein [Alsobacter metallidurans]GGH13963.1 hypothetical protein GCM10007036_12930 [Alsobacter metallidurans]